MEPLMDIILIVLPIAFVGAIALFIITRLKAKQKRGTLGRKETTEAQTLLDSLIPLGMIFGSGVGVVVGIVFSISLGNAIVLGTGIGMLVGYFAYEFYSKEESHS
ncbi:hypothetical protein QL992_06140 [Microbacterium sp. APC 3898]|uniref:Uncharacterized protein n=2 Tax=Planococcus notacanthi TaxID=3035188 RepID=A0ABT7ZMW9_9BACL|nr:MULTISPECIES: hypothetical protein [Terrabacteria group]MDN3428512.1 hypothetical protein [Planococcus sp. APC 4016]MDN3498781.1 hypothetical protein [Microbacterium sp. APC 3898]